CSPVIFLGITRVSPHSTSATVAQDFTNNWLIKSIKLRLHRSWREHPYPNRRVAAASSSQISRPLWMVMQLEAYMAIRSKRQTLCHDVSQTLRSSTYNRQPHTCLSQSKDSRSVH